MLTGPTCHVLLLRHGQSTWNADGRWQGQADPPLSPVGERQATDAVPFLSTMGFTAVVASDLRRARRTADILAAALGLDGVRLEPGLREIDVGDWTGLTRTEIEARWPGELADWAEGRSDSIPGGESRLRLADRTVATLTALATDAPTGARLLVVSHGALIRNLDRSLGLAPESIPNLAGRRYEIDLGAGGTGGGRVTPGALVSLAPGAVEHK